MGGGLSDPRPGRTTWLTGPRARSSGPAARTPGRQDAVHSPAAMAYFRRPSVARVFRAYIPSRASSRWPTAPNPMMAEATAGWASANRRACWRRGTSGVRCCSSAALRLRWRPGSSVQRQESPSPTWACAQQHHDPVTQFRMAPDDSGSSGRSSSHELGRMRLQQPGRPSHEDRPRHSIDETQQQCWMQSGTRSRHNAQSSAFTITIEWPASAGSSGLTWGVAWPP